MRLILILLFFSGNLVYAQSNRTIYFDTESQVTTSEKDYFYSTIKQDKVDTSLYTVKTYYSDGTRMLSGNYRAVAFPADWEKLHQFDFEGALKEGIHEENYKDGRLRSQTTYTNGLPEGEVNRYHENGKLSARYLNKQGKPEGDLIEYHGNGKKRTKAKFKAGKVIERITRYDENEKELPD